MNEACSVKQQSEFDKILVEFDNQLKRMDGFSNEISNKVRMLGYLDETPSACTKENPTPPGIVGALTDRINQLRAFNDSLLNSKEGLVRLV